MFTDSFLAHASRTLDIPRSHVILYLLGGSTPLEWGRQRVLMVMYEDWQKENASFDVLETANGPF